MKIKVKSYRNIVISNNKMIVILAIIYILNIFCILGTA